MIEAALRESRGRVSGSSGAAAKLGIPGSTLESKIRSLKINKNHFKTNPSADHTQILSAMSVLTGWEKRQFLALRFCRSRRKGSALKNLAGALHIDGGGCTFSCRPGRQNGNPRLDFTSKN